MKILQSSFQFLDNFIQYTRLFIRTYDSKPSTIDKVYSLDILRLSVSQLLKRVFILTTKVPYSLAGDIDQLRRQPWPVRQSLPNHGDHKVKVSRLSRSALHSLTSNSQSQSNEANPPHAS